jgi:hypothetical protein
MENITVKLPDSLIAMLNAAAKKRGESRSAIIRSAIENFVVGESKTQTGSCLDFSADLAGCVEGPPDLSHNRKHMRRYGE